LVTNLRIIEPDEDICRPHVIAVAYAQFADDAAGRMLER
jgi:hypothetical protein